MTFRQSGHLVSKALAVFIGLAALRTLTITVYQFAAFKQSSPDYSWLWISLGVPVVSVIVLAFLSAHFWIRADSFAPRDTVLASSRIDLMTIEGVIYRALGIWMILTSAPDVAEAIVVKAFTGAGGPGAIGFSVGILEARMISPIVTLCGGMILFIIGNRSPRRMPGIPGDNALKRAANWIWNPPLDEEEEPPEEEQGASK